MNINSIQIITSKGKAESMFISPKSGEYDNYVGHTKIHQTELYKYIEVKLDAENDKKLKSTIGYLSTQEST